MRSLPEGTMTFMLMDLHGSTHAWEAQPKTMRMAMVRHYEILVRTVGEHNGNMVKAWRDGDSVLAVFTTAAAAAECALEIQERFAAESWPDGLAMKLRVAMHTGEAQLRQGHYFGPALNRCARLLAICHSGQILLTKATESMLGDVVPAGAALQDLGPHRLKNLNRPEHVFQLDHLARITTSAAIHSLPEQRTNMPHYLTSFVGREAELSALKSLLANSRLVTLTGAGGSGKTRLAVELGWSCLQTWPDGVWWVDLTSVNDPGVVPGAAVATLQLPGRGPALDVVAAWLTRRRALLVLDNCEHLVAACARFCDALLQRCPELTVLTTTREVLGVPGEARWQVSSMTVVDAVALFEARARLAAPEFKVVTSNQETVTQICQHLDGIPLAIELAAARVGMMTEREVLVQLANRFTLLTGGSRTAPSRQQTMIATIDWSYRLLDDQEAVLFRRLSVFRGGFTLESAQAVCTSTGDEGVLDALTGLLQKSMVVVESAEDSGTRYRLLESQLVYAEERLTETGELEVVRRRHYDYFRDALSKRSDHLALRHFAAGVPDAEWKARELSNLWAAMEWAQANAEDFGLRLAVDLSIVPQVDATRARGLLTELLDQSPATGLHRARAFIRIASLAQLQGDSAGGSQAADAGLALARELGDVDVIASALLRAGALRHFDGDPETAAKMYEEATSLLEGSGNRRLSLDITNNKACLAMERGDFRAARELMVDCVAAAKADGNALYDPAYVDTLAAAQLGIGDTRAASAGYVEALSSYRSFRDPRGFIVCLQGLSRVATAKGDDEPAVRLAAAASRMSRELTLMDDPWATRFTVESLRRSQSKLGKRKSADAWNQGWSMTMDQAIGYALGEREPEATIDAGPLTRREREVARLVASGLTNREIAEQLFIAERSAEGHVERIRNKLGVRSRTEVATWALEHGLMPESREKGGTAAAPPSTQRRKPS